jgi:rare lipoprotein A
MNRFTGAIGLLSVVSLMGCAIHKPSAPVPAPAAPAGAPQAFAPATPPPLRPSEVLPPASAEEPVFTQTGLASFYAARFHGRKTASGGRYDRDGFTAAHRTLGFGIIVRVTDTRNGRVVKVAINDRGPHVKSRIIDLSHAAAQALGIRHGMAHVRLEVFLSDQAGGAGLVETRLEPSSSVQMLDAPSP